MRNFKYVFLLFCISLLFYCAANKKVHKNTNPVIIIQTEPGNIEVELYPEKAPATVANFLKYIDAAMYKESRFHRTVTDKNQPNNKVKINVIQAGRKRNGMENFPPIRIETTDVTGILHKDGVISMARSDPNSATSHFFICVGDQPSLDYGGKRNSDGYGFAAFGKVISGMEIVRKIHKQPCKGQSLTPPIIIRDIVRKNK